MILGVFGAECVPTDPSPRSSHLPIAAMCDAAVAMAPVRRSNKLLPREALRKAWKPSRRNTHRPIPSNWG